MKKCNYCGRENDDKAIACTECGNEFSASPKSETDQDLRDPALSPVVVATFASLQEASLLAGRLEEAGIEAFVPEEYSEQVFSAVIPLARLTVRVAAKDYEAARAVIVAEGGEERELATASPGDSELKGRTGATHRAAGSDADPACSEGGKLCVSCNTVVPSEATICPKCGWPQPPPI